ncbi:MAG: phosphodiester glycosidase family protein [Bacillota bacterium]
MIVIFKYSKVFLLLLLLTLISLSVNAQSNIYENKNIEKFIRDGKTLEVVINTTDYKNPDNIDIITEEKAVIQTDTGNKSVNLLKDQNYQLQIKEVSEEYYKLQIFATDDRSKADKLWLELVQLGYDDVKISKEKNIYQVRLGKFNTKETAEGLVIDLKKRGFSPWFVKEYRQAEPRIFVYNKENENIFTGQKLTIKGRVNIAGNIYDGQIKTQLDYKNNLVISNKTSLENIIAGIIGNDFKNVNLDSTENTEIAKAYSIILRTYILYDILNSNTFDFGSLYKGITDDKRIKDIVAETDGLILTKINTEKDIEFNIGNPVNKTDISSKKILQELLHFKTLQSSDYKVIISSAYQNYQLIDLKKLKTQKMIVDAEIEWGLEYKEIRELSWKGPLVYTILELDLDDKKYSFEPVLANSRIAGLSDLGEMTREENAIAGVNGGFFHYSGRPLGLIYINNKIVSEPVKYRTTLLLTKDNKVFFDKVKWHGYLKNQKSQITINGINRKPGTDQITLFNKYYGISAPDIKRGVLEIVVENNIVSEVVFTPNTSGDLGSSIPENGFVIQAHGRAVEKLIHLGPGDNIRFINEFEPDFDMKNVKTAISAGPTLIKNGDIEITSLEEEFQPDIAYGRAPRSAVGITDDNKLIFITVDGRQSHSIGITLEELAGFMKNYGIVQGMNLDGGSSARMVVRGFTMNKPSAERLISNGILIKLVSKYINK